MKKIVILLLSLICLQANAQISNYSINRNISCTDTIRPFGTNTYSYGISIDGEGQLFSDTAFIRVVLTDNNDHEWLVYERNSLYATEEDISFQNAAFETAALDNIVPNSVIITLRDATFYLSSIKNNRTYTDRNVVTSVSDSVFLEKNLQIVERINAKLSANKKAWRADTTFLSNLRYKDKKTMFGNELPNLQGWDYYAYGYYSPLDDNTPPASDNIVKEFDWRTRHGACNPGTFYYNPDGSGWIPKRYHGQYHAECWAFSVQYATEAIVNLYYNRAINDRLSVQDILSCSQGGSWNNGGHPNIALDYVTNEGIVTESCFPYYPGQTISCDTKCQQPNEKVSIAGRSGILYDEERIKENLITKGALVGVVRKWGHAMCLVGFGVVKAGDPILYGNIHGSTDQDIYVASDSPDIGKPYYIFKQSYADYGYDNSAFCNIIINANDHSKFFCYSINTPITSLLYDDDDILCVDNDGDGYYNWGIGPKPATCPNCPDEEDSDDSSPLVGPYNEKYESVILCDDYVYSTIPEHITTNVLWGSEKYIDHDIIIENGGVLTVKNTAYMGESTKIIVKPGGKLILDYRSVLTGMCGSMWQGVEVWGNKNTHQYAVNGSYGQGYVELKNGATIENAICALNLWQPDHWSNTGGIVHATDAVFRNNHRSVHALYYKNFHPTNLKETDYNATFRRCQFVVNENYLGDEDHVFHKHVDLSHVRGFKFYACDFSVTAPSNNISYWTSGIAGNEAGFLVKGVCDSYQIPCSNYDQCTFTGFFTAINAVSDGSKSAPAITVRQTSFDNNDFGIYMRKLSNASILFSDFDVKRQDNWLCGAGIFSENMFNFTIEENEFKKNNTFNGNSIGVYIKNSDLKNIIYNNLFMNLYCGNLAIGKNIEGVGSEHLGLEYLCNTNIGNNIDFYVSKEPNVYSGIQINQGSALAAARNTFSENGYHFYNGGDFIVSYYYYNVPGFENERPLYFNSDKFFPIPTDQTSGCPSHYSGTAVDTVVISPERRQQLEQEYYEAYNTYHSLKTIYEQHVDGGNTQNELNDITTATPSDMWALRAQLLNHSPFLSGKVLETSADHPNVLPEPVLFEILISNPDELKKDSLIDYLESIDNPLPQDKINMLRQIANGTTAKTVMQTQMAASKRDFSRAAGEIIRSLVNDTIFNVAEYREWLTNMEDINADHEIIATYVDEGDFTTALALADMLPSLYGLTGTDLAEHQDYKDLLMLYRDWYNDGRNAMQMNSTERATVEHIADYSTGIPQMMARTLLEESTGESDAENSFACVTLTLPEGGQGRGNTFTQEDFGKAMGMNVSVKPNPATTWTAVDYTLPAKMAQATIRVTNALGVTVMTAELNGNQGQKVLDLRNLADGVYVYTISCGEYVQTGKLVIAK